MSLAENNPNESHKQGANNICQIVLNFVPLDKRPEDYSFGPFSYSNHLSANYVALTLVDCGASQIFFIFLVIFDKLRAFFEKMV